MQRSLLVSLFILAYSFPGNVIMRRRRGRGGGRAMLLIIFFFPPPTSDPCSSIRSSPFPLHLLLFLFISPHLLAAMTFRASPLQAFPSLLCCPLDFPSSLPRAATKLSSLPSLPFRSPGFVQFEDERDAKDSVEGIDGASKEKPELCGL